MGEKGLSQHQNLLSHLREFQKQKGPSLQLDADIFLLNAALVSELVESVTKKIHIKSKVYCRFFGSVYRGVLFFSESMAEAMLMAYHDAEIQKREDFVIRPFRTVIERAMRSLGADPLDDFDERVIGIHDFGQFRQHIFYKMVNRSWREDEGTVRGWAKRWSMSLDADFRCAAQGLRYGSQLEPVHLRYEDLEGQFGRLGFSEKPRVITRGEVIDWARQARKIPTLAEQIPQIADALQP